MSTDRSISDALVLGSSPLMLMIALRLARDVPAVQVISNQSSFGGAWRTAETGGTQKVEIACHVIEPFPGVYELLSEYSGVRFEDLSLQPVRVHPLGFRLRYLSRPILLLSMIRMAAKYCLYSVGGIFSHRFDHELANYSTKAKSLLKYQSEYLVRKASMKGPECGYAEFIDALIARCERANISFRTATVTGVSRCDDSWVVLTDTVGEVHCRSIHCSSSIPLVEKALGQYDVAKSEAVKRSSVVVDFADTTVTNRHSYVSFWRNPLVRRISRVDGSSVPRGRVRYLFELGDYHEEVGEETQAEMVAAALRAGLIKAGPKFEVVGTVDCLTSLPAFQLDPGAVREGLNVYYSFGNLAAGIAAHRDFLESKGSRRVEEDS